MGILLGKTADIGIIIPCAEVIGLRLAEISAVKYIAHAVRDRQLAIVAVLLRNNAVWHTHAAVGIVFDSTFSLFFAIQPPTVAKPHTC